LIFIPNFSEGKGKDFSTNQEQKECFFIKNAELSHVIDIQEAIGDKMPRNNFINSLKKVSPAIKIREIQVGKFKKLSFFN
jgi:hypothetical protein